MYSNMSVQLTRDQVLFHQRILKASGYDLVLDGIWGKHTNEADKDFSSKSLQIKDSWSGFRDVRSEANIFTLVLKAQDLCRNLITNGILRGYDVRVISGTRTYSEQDRLYSQGRTNPGKIITNACGGQSLHNFGIAWDIALFKHGLYVTDSFEYIEFKNAILIGDLRSELEWGGDWSHLKDEPHYQLRVGSANIEIVRINFERGEQYYV